MDPVKAKEIQAMKSYKKSHFLYNLILHSLTALMCSLLCTSHYWFPSMKNFFISLPYIWSSFFNPKCLFIVVNVIVVFLVGESKLVGSHSSSPANEIYDEYVERSRRLRGVSRSLQEKKEEEKLEMNLVNETAKNIEHEEMKQQQQQQEQEDKEEVEEKEEEEEVKGNVEVAEEVDEEKERDGEEENGLPTEELNKRIDEFIARVNKQRWLEAKLLVC